jgi:hypothetical protein
MYTGVGQDSGMVFLPGSLTPRPTTTAAPAPQPPRLILKLKPDGGSCSFAEQCAGGICYHGVCRTGVKLKQAAPAESTPTPVPSLVVSEGQSTTEPGAPKSSKLPLYIAAGGVAALGIAWLVMRK